MSINASFIGNIGKNAKVTQTQNGVFTNFSVAVNEPFFKEKTQWVDCSFYGERGAKLAQHLIAGIKVFVTGKLSQEVFVKESGESVTKLKVWVGDLEFASAKPKDEGQPVPQNTTSVSISNSYQDIPF